MNTPYLSSKMYSSYIKEAAESGILTCELHSEVDDDSSLKACLARSRHMAIKEFRSCHKDLLMLFEKITKIEEEIKEDIDNIRKNYPTYTNAWDKIFEHFNLQLSNIFQYALESLINSFSKKIKRIDNFTICLFGRTKAGKSTTMEALTGGDGLTIGKGRQNTTKDVKEYYWRELLVVDTPGIDAMEKKDQLESMALSYADESDLIVFLLPHQIEEGDFDKFSRFYKQNKPILFLLNIKKEIGEKDSMEYKMFLKHTDDIFEKNKITGYKKRIFDLMFEKLNVNKDLIPIIPIHAASAFMSTKEESTDVKRNLYKCSNFHLLENQLAKEISEYGELYRIKNPHDSVILFAEKIMSEFNIFKEILEKEREIFEKNISKFEKIKADILKKKNVIAMDIIASYFDSKANSVSLLVDTLFSERDEHERNKILQHFMPESAIKSKIDEAQKEIVKIVEHEIKNFFKSFARDMQTINFEDSKSEICRRSNSNIDNINTVDGAAKILDGVSVASGIILSLGTVIVTANIGILGASGTLFGLGSANIWNPVGWCLLAASVLTGFLGLFARHKHKQKVADAKEKAEDEITKKLFETKHKILDQMNQWVTNILSDLEKNHIGVMKRYVKYSIKHITDCEKLFSDLETMRRKSMTNKMRRMLRRIQKDDHFKIKNVKEDDHKINIIIEPQRMLIKKKEAEQILSRVEEKSVTIAGGLQ